MCCACSKARSIRRCIAWSAAALSETNRQVKFYELTKAGRRELEIERHTWEKLTAAVSQILESA